MLPHEKEFKFLSTDFFTDCCGEEVTEPEAKAPCLSLDPALTYYMFMSCGCSFDGSLSFALSSMPYLEKADV